MNFKNLFLIFLISAGLSNTINCNDLKLKSKEFPKEQLILTKLQSAGLGLATLWIYALVGLNTPHDIQYHNNARTIYSDDIVMNILAFSTIYAFYKIYTHSIWGKFSRASKLFNNLDKKLINLAQKSKDQKKFIEHIKNNYKNSPFPFISALEDFINLYNQCFESWEIYHNILKRFNPDDKDFKNKQLEIEDKLNIISNAISIIKDNLGPQAI